MNIDLNADFGEGYGVYTFGHDDSLMPHITSANIACGFHAGDPTVMQRTVAFAKAHGVSLGAHPGYRDREGFGRRIVRMSDSELENMILYQLGALSAFVHAQGGTLKHVKLHGALYTLASQDMPTAKAIARAVTRFDSKLILVGLAQSALVNAAHEFGLRAAREGFVDRAYKKDGSLMPRTASGALVASPARAVQVAMQIVREGTVRAIDGSLMPLEVDTLCVHSDAPNAVEIAKALHEALKAEGVQVQAIV
jgi:UPF0271 protein